MPTQLAIVCALLAINAFTLFAFWSDKVSARNGERRTPESTLLLLAFLGGSAGAILGQQAFRHKTRKEPFRSRLRAIIGLHMGLCLMAAGYFLAMTLSR